ncbi:phenylalanine--tRNA ligase alpha subunit, cytoplasmic [Dioscorea cayenensis subsp. rotundata]|uniref:phenylalanine--tRNA ligase n=1 Tax=Dioscorea cayennensis subsp. rotundata TaxID=55577 RepID=A0AB40BQ28_DIOCR|nr:phenylalanine--tRNA ligase alpha subunit, cytoplasmic [Dioscorea cayenensis subsp. rotundata]
MDPAKAAENTILEHLQSHDEIPDSQKFAASSGFDHGVVENVIKSLCGSRTIEANEIKEERWALTDEGKSYVDSGSPEVQFFRALPSEGEILMKDLEKKLDPTVYKVGPSAAIVNKWVTMRKEKREVPGSTKPETIVYVSRKINGVEDKVKDLLQKIEAGEAVDEKDVDALKRRKLVILQTWRGYSIRKGPEYVLVREKTATDLTREHIQRGDWKQLKFKEYNLSAQVQPIQIGYVQPLLEVKEEIQNIFLQMGFEEMPTNNYVESSFWNFDALFQPQQHPARDSHDTFFLKVPSTTKQLPEDYLERVKQVHQSGGYGSKGYEYDWKREEAEKNLLRTHTTAVSTRMLYKLAQQKSFVPKRYFSIDRVFRNEAVDRTHLAEFHQIEGLICDRGLSLGDLLGVLEDFFSRLGMTKLRFKPAYNPYTEPSMEIFSYHDGLKKWVEVGNSGMFRPEMLLPMGLPEDVNVIAWGLSLERPTMILYGIDNIRDLFGHKVDFDVIKNNPLCRLGLQ